MEYSPTAHTSDCTSAQRVCVMPTLPKHSIDRQWQTGFDGHYTLTGEVVKCLTNDVMTDPGCVFAQTKPTHIVFFTDGLDNGCQSVNRAAKELVSEHTNAEIYAIGIGDIERSGVADLRTDPDSQTIFFNFKTLAELVGTWKVFKTNFLDTGDSRGNPVDFGTPSSYNCSTYMKLPSHDHRVQLQK